MSLIDQCSTEPMTNETRRTIFKIINENKINYEYNRKCKSYINDILTASDSVRCRNAKAILLIHFFKFIVENISFIVAHNNFRNTVVNRAKELLLEKPFDNENLDKEFRSILRDTIYIYDQ